MGQEKTEGKGGEGYSEDQGTFGHCLIMCGVHRSTLIEVCISKAVDT